MRVRDQIRKLKGQIRELRPKPPNGGILMIYDKTVRDAELRREAEIQKFRETYGCEPTAVICLDELDRKI